MKFCLILSVIFSSLLINSNSLKIIVIGSGASGISAANEAIKSGIQVTLLEARNRIGGRIFTDNTLGYPVDLGAAWIHGITNNPVYELTTQYKINTFLFDYENTKYYSDFLSQLELEATGSSMKQLSQAFESYLKSKRDQGTPDVPLSSVFEDFLQQKNLDEKSKGLIKNWIYQIENENAATVENLSRDYYDVIPIREKKDVLFPGGYNEIFKQLSKNMDIQFEKIVTKIIQNSTTNKVTVTTKTGENYEADYVIVTIPLGCLKRNLIQFSPELSEKKKNAIKTLGFGTLDKIVIEFTENFWDNTNVIQIMNNPLNAFNFIINFFKVANKNTLVFLIGGYGKYYSLYNNTNEKIIDDVVAFLKTIYKGKNIQSKKYLITRWSNDEFAYGSYTSYAPGSTPEMVKEFSQPEGRIYFAGEHTNNENLQTVLGAYTSGIDAARKIITKEGNGSSNAKINGNIGQISKFSLLIIFLFILL